MSELLESLPAWSRLMSCNLKNPRRTEFKSAIAKIDSLMKDMAAYYHNDGPESVVLGGRVSQYTEPLLTNVSYGNAVPVTGASLDWDD